MVDRAEVLSCESCREKKRQPLEKFTSASTGLVRLMAWEAIGTAM